MSVPMIFTLFCVLRYLQLLFGILSRGRKGGKKKKNEHASVHGDYRGGYWEKQFEVHSGKRNPEEIISSIDVTMKLLYINGMLACSIFFLRKKNILFWLFKSSQVLSVKETLF